MKRPIWKRLWQASRFPWRQSRFDRDLAEEMEFHRSMLEGERLAEGASAEESRFAARRQLGNATRLQEQAREVWMLEPLFSFLRDLRYGTRSLGRNRSFTIVAVLALALGIGVNTSLFTVFNAIALQPWSVKDPNRMVSIFAGAKEGDREIRGLSYSEFAYQRDHTRTLSGIVVSRGVERFPLGDGARPANGMYVSGNYFSVLGAEMIYGRGFIADEDQVGKPRQVVVISHDFWQAHYGGDPGAVGRVLKISDEPFTIVGITAPGFGGMSVTITDIWAPLADAKVLDPELAQRLTSVHHCCLDVAGRLRPGVTRAQAEAELTVLSGQYTEREKLKPELVHLGPATFLARPELGRKIYSSMAMMLLGVGLVLLIACANVSNLLLARCAARRQEIAVRLSLGASRMRLIRQLMTESVLLAIVGGTLALALAWKLPAFVMAHIGEERLTFRFVPDATVLGYTALISLLASISFGLAPALHATRRSLGAALKKEGAIGSSRLRGLLLGLQVAVCCILLTGAALLTRGLRHAQTLDPGFAIRDVAVVTLDIRLHRYDARKLRQFFDTLQQRALTMPGVREAGVTSTIPLGNRRNFTSVTIDGRAPSKLDGSNFVLMAYVSPRYLETLRLRVLRGRGFSERDQDGAVALIDETMAKQFWPGANPIGRVIEVGSKAEVIGIVKPAQVSSLGAAATPFLYILGHGDADSALLVRTDGNPQALAAALPKLVKEMDPALEPSAYLLSDNLERSILPAQLAASLAGSLGVLALTLACVGIYGVAAWAVQQRIREIGIRMALGANPGQVLSLLLRQNGRAVLIGAFVGLGGAALISVAMTEFLYGISPLDPFAYIGVVILLAGGALAASYGPARKATQVDPSTALRWE